MSYVYAVDVSDVGMLVEALEVYSERLREKDRDAQQLSKILKKTDHKENPSHTWLDAAERYSEAAQERRKTYNQWLINVAKELEGDMLKACKPESKFDEISESTACPDGSIPPNE